MKRLPTCLALLLTLPLTAAAQTSATLNPRVRVETTAGAFVIELDAARAPLTAENFLRYVRDGYYDGLIMHRVMPNFVVQGGGYDIGYAERPARGPIPNESGNGLQNRRGTVGMARDDSPHSATSQFYVNLADNPTLSPLPSRWGYAVFGRVVEGMDVLDRIAHVATGARGPFASDVPLEQVVLTRVAMDSERPAAASSAPPPSAGESTAAADATEPPPAPAPPPDPGP